MRGGAIGLMVDRMVAAAWPEVAPARGGGDVVAALPPRLGFRQNVGAN
jgi:hypothetical protein